MVNVNQIYIRGNDITTLDQFINLGTSFAGVFYDIYKSVYKPITAKSGNSKLDGLLYRTQFFLTTEKVSYSRQAYGMLDLLGDLGGVTEVLMIVFGIILFPISEHSFYLHAARLLFLGKTEDESLFKDAEKWVGNEKYLDPEKFPKNLDE